MAKLQGIHELRATFDHIMSKRGDVAELRAAFDRNILKSEAEANSNRRTRSASPHLHSSPFDVPERSPCDVPGQPCQCVSGGTTPEQWPSPRQCCAPSVDNSVQHQTFTSNLPGVCATPHQFHDFPRNDHQRQSPCDQSFWPWFATHGQPHNALYYVAPPPTQSDVVAHVAPQGVLHRSAGQDESDNGGKAANVNCIGSKRKNSKPERLYSRRHQHKVEEVGGRNSIPNPDKTEANRKKKEKKDGKARAAGKMNRLELRAQQRETKQ
jgi:hypothetical protein